MTKQDYVLIAKVLHGTKPEAGAYYDRANPGEIALDTWENTCLAFLHQFKQDNPNFDSGTLPQGVQR